MFIRNCIPIIALWGLSTQAHAERFSVETHYDTGLDTQCYEGVTATGPMEDSGQMRYGTLNAILPAPCEVAPGTTPTTNAQHAIVSFFLPDVAPNGFWLYDFSNTDLELYEIDDVVGITATGSFWIAEGLESGTNWSNAPESGVGSPVIHNMNPFSGGYNLVSFIAPSSQANFGAAAQTAWDQSADGNFSLRLFAEQPKLPTADGDGFASLESNESGHPNAFPFTLTLDRTEVQCLESAHCDDGNVCNGEETCIGNACMPGTNADAGMTCSGGECNGLGGCVAFDLECTEAADCNDSNDCTLDLCTDNECSNLDKPVETPCADGFCDGGMCETCVTDENCGDMDVCNGLESCLENECTGSPEPLSCEDNNECTADTCDIVDGCAHGPVADGTTCDDGTCQGGMCEPNPVFALWVSECDDDDASQAICVDVNNYCPCAAPGAYGVPGYEYGDGGSLKWQQRDYFFCVLSRTHQLRTPNPLKHKLRRIALPRRPVNVQCSNI